MDPWLSTWYLSAIPVVIVYIIMVFVIAKTKATADEVGQTIRSIKDLDILKPTIDLNMKAAIILIATYLLYILAVAYFVFIEGMSLRVVSGHLFIFAITIIPIILYGKNVESTIRNLKLETDDPEVVETFHRWLKQWDQPRWRLPD